VPPSARQFLARAHLLIDGWFAAALEGYRLGGARFARADLAHDLGAAAAGIGDPFVFAAAAPGSGLAVGAIGGRVVGPAGLDDKTITAGVGGELQNHRHRIGTFTRSRLVLPSLGG
jgi:hypothetical protein